MRKLRIGFEWGLTSTERERRGSVHPFILLCWTAPAVAAVFPVGRRKQELFSSHCLGLAEGSSGLEEVTAPVESKKSERSI